MDCIRGGKRGIDSVAELVDDGRGEVGDAAADEDSLRGVRGKVAPVGAVVFVLVAVDQEHGVCLAQGRGDAADLRGDGGDVARGEAVHADDEGGDGAVGEGDVVHGEVGRIPVVPFDAPVVAGLGDLVVGPLGEGEGVVDEGGSVDVVGGRVRV